MEKEKKIFTVTEQKPQCQNIKKWREKKRRNPNFEEIGESLYLSENKGVLAIAYHE
jgi:hypothetical protein